MPDDIEGYTSRNMRKNTSVDLPRLFYWCHMSDVFQTVNGENIDHYKLKELVSVFNLSDDLLQINRIR